VTVLGVYLTTLNGGGEICGPNDSLFPGSSQYSRFVKIMNDILEEHREEFRTQGIDIDDIGSHSIRKGATTWISSQPGGPSSMSICIRGGWTLGGVKDVYMTYEAEGDCFVGRMLALLHGRDAMASRESFRFVPKTNRRIAIEGRPPGHPGHQYII
jgi:hypothetical protein